MKSVNFKAKALLAITMLLTMAAPAVKANQSPDPNKFPKFPGQVRLCSQLINNELNIRSLEAQVLEELKQVLPDCAWLAEQYSQHCEKLDQEVCWADTAYIRANDDCIMADINSISDKKITAEIIKKKRAEANKLKAVWENKKKELNECMAQLQTQYNAYKEYQKKLGQKPREITLAEAQAAFDQAKIKAINALQTKKDTYTNVARIALDGAPNGKTEIRNWLNKNNTWTLMVLANSCITPNDYDHLDHQQLAFVLKEQLEEDGIIPSEQLKKMFEDE